MTVERPAACYGCDLFTDAAKVVEERKQIFESHNRAYQRETIADTLAAARNRLMISNEFSEYQQALTAFRGQTLRCRVGHCALKEQES